MENTMCLLENTGVGRSVPSDGSATGSISTVNNMVFSSEVCSSYPDEDDDDCGELELGLGLSLGGAGTSLIKSSSKSGGQYARILTAKDMPSLVSKSSYSSSHAVPKPNHKRTAADCVSPPNGASSQVVGWPPIRAYRKNSLNQTKLPINGDFNTVADQSKSPVVNKDNNGCNKHANDAMDKGHLKTSLYVKVNMDGTPIGRKVDLNAHNSYETLSQTLEHMFCESSRISNTSELLSLAAFIIVGNCSFVGSSIEGHNSMAEAGKPSKLLVGSSEFVLTYEDKEGDWMLVGDVPWRMFASSVKRLRIMTTSGANGLAPKMQERHGRQRARAI